MTTAAIRSCASPLSAWGLAALALACAPALAQTPGKTGSTQGIYTCVNSQGQRITADRPIAECLDREQQQLGNTGVVRRVVPPSYTAEERAQLEAKRKAEEEQRARLAEEKRRDRALLVRYPTQASHDRERAEALKQVDDVVAAVIKREKALTDQRKGIDAEMEFYKKDLSKAPAWLRRQLEDNEQQMQVQKRFLDEQAQEKRRINTRFDEELAKLRTLWASNAAAARP